MAAIGSLMLDIGGTQLTEEDIECIRHPACGGLILFSRNFQSVKQIESLIASIRETKQSVNQSIIIAVDQEGGRVQRFKQGFTKLPPLGRLGQLFSDDPLLAQQRACQLGELMSLEMLSIGCDISFSPVLDLGLENSKIIADRAFSKDPEIITCLGSAFITGMAQAGMAATGKHFPGHGSVIEDSHVSIPLDNRNEKTIWQQDLKPFINLHHQLLAIMPAHIIYSQIDTHPAGFSNIWIEQILRTTMAFKGAVFSDDLSMKGAEVAGDFKQRADLALSAGCDMVLLCNNRGQSKKILDHLENFYMMNASKQRLNRMLANANLSIGLNSLKQTDRWQKLTQQIQLL